MEVNFLTMSQFWRPIEEPLELVYEDAYDRATNNSKFYSYKMQHNDYSQQYFKSHGQLLSQKIDYWQEISREIIKPDNFKQHNFRFQIFSSQNFIIDDIDKNWVLCNNQNLPTLAMNFNDEIKHSGLIQKSENDIWIQIFLCEQAHSTDHKKLKVMKGALGIDSKKRCTTLEKIDFNKLSLYLKAETDRNYNFIIALYQQTQNQKNYHHLIISQDISIIERRNCIKLISAKKIYPYFKIFSSRVLSQPPFIVHLNKSDEESYEDEISIFQNVLVHRKNKITNLFYLAYKYPHFVDIFYRVQVEEENPIEKLKNLLLNVDVLLIRLNHDINQGIVCNYFNPECKFVLKFNCKLKNVRYFVQKKFTKLISIINSEDTFKNELFQKFQTIQELKKFYEALETEASLLPKIEHEIQQSYNQQSSQFSGKKHLQSFEQRERNQNIRYRYYQRYPQMINFYQNRIFQDISHREQYLNERKMKKNQIMSKIMDKEAIAMRQKRAQPFPQSPQLHLNQPIHILPNFYNYSHPTTQRQLHSSNVSSMPNQSLIERSNLIRHMPQRIERQHPPNHLDYQKIQHHGVDISKDHNQFPKPLPKFCSCCPVQQYKNSINVMNRYQLNKQVQYQNPELNSIRNSRFQQNIQRPSIIYQPRKYSSNSECENNPSRSNTMQLYPQSNHIRVAERIHPIFPPQNFRSISQNDLNQNQLKQSRRYIPVSRNIIFLQRNSQPLRSNSQILPLSRVDPIHQNNFSYQNPRRQQNNLIIEPNRRAIYFQSPNAHPIRSNSQSNIQDRFVKKQQ